MKRMLINFCLMLIIPCQSCDKFLDVGSPPDKVSSQFVFSSNSSAAAVLTGIYFDLQSTGFAQGRNGMSLYMGLSSDEFNLYPLSTFRRYFINEIFFNFWSPIYSYIYRLNTAIEGLKSSDFLSEDVKSQLLGEAQFVRAFCYFYLVNIYGDVPLLLTSDYKANSKHARDKLSQVYIQIEKDLIEAKELLSDDYVSADASTRTSDRVRPTKWAALALLARVALFLGKWQEAADFSTEVINNKSLYDTIDINNVFKKNNKEAIWQLESISQDGLVNTQDARLFILINGVPDFSNSITLSSSVLSRFEHEDLRLAKWVGKSVSDSLTYYYPNKYKLYDPDDASDENITVLRLGEQYLIKAEALAELGNIDMAIDAINSVRIRARTSRIVYSNKQQLLMDILKERSIELFSEWGHRWFDLKRTQSLDSVMLRYAPIKGGLWDTHKKVYPIPIDELKYNTSLQQNDGYPSS
jgi:hypothetical protein